MDKLANTLISMNGQWQFRQAGTEEWRPATVPGCNFTDLIDNDLIPDPFFGENENKLQWIEQQDWEYRCYFDFADNSEDNWQLIFDGLDTYCDVYLNDKLLGSGNNMFVQQRFSINALQPTNNCLHLVFLSPITRTMPLYTENGFTYPAENDKSEERLSVYSRKAPYHFGWDWGPRFITSGIWRDVYLQKTAVARIDEVQIKQQSLSDELAVVKIVIDVEASKDASLLLAAKLKDTQESVSSKILFSEAGKQQAELTLQVNNPQRWWPNGLGEAFLYQLDITLSCELQSCEMQIIDQYSQQLGLRTIEVINEPDEHGESFYFKVNGHPVFMKGANYIPADSFLNRVDSNKNRKVFEDAVAANMNMLRVWGGGIYQDDEFYQLADQHGILIWQDFMFACTLYPGDKAFIDNVREEAEYNIKRLRNHACLALWCGNNEVDMAIAHWQWPEKFGYSEPLQQQLQQDYDRLFKETLPTAVSALDEERFYLTSSPIGFWENEEEDGKGNHHYWGVWHGELPFSEYARRIPRFMSEFGFQSFPLIESVEQFIPQDQHQLESDAMLVHQKHPRGNKLIQQYLAEDYQPAKDFASLLYLSQVQQAWGIKVAFDAHRRHKPYCMGTLYWQFNDCWPVASWSGIDYFGRWKALHYQAKRSFESIIPVIERNEDKLDIYVVSDLLEDQQLTLETKVLSFNGEAVFEQVKLINAAANVSELHNSLNITEITAAKNQASLVLQVRLLDGDKAFGENSFYFKSVKELDLAQAEINAELTNMTPEGLASFSLTTNTLVKDLCITLTKEATANEAINPSDNFFDLIPGKPKVISFKLPKNLQILSSEEVANQLQYRSVYDTYLPGATNES